MCSLPSFKKITLVTSGMDLSPEIVPLEESILKRLRTPYLPEIKKELPSTFNKTKDILCLLDERGEQYSTEELAVWFEKKFLSPQRLIFVIGPSQGHNKEIRTQAHISLSLSKLTFPHQWVRPLFLEQLYRLQCLQQGHPYHSKNSSPL